MRTALIACAIAIGSAAPLAATAQTTPHRHRQQNRNPNSPSPATRDCSVTTASAGLRKLTTNPRFKAVLISRTSPASIWATGTRTSSKLLFNGASLEMDFYGGYKTTFGDFGLDVGVIYYYYPGTKKFSPGLDAKNFEAYVGGTWGPASLKYYYSFTDFFGINIERSRERAGRYRNRRFAVSRPDADVSVRRRLGRRRARRLAEDRKSQEVRRSSVSKKTAITTTSSASPTTSQAPAGSRAPRSSGPARKICLQSAMRRKVAARRAQ